MANESALNGLRVGVIGIRFVSTGTASSVILRFPILCQFRIDWVETRAFRAMLALVGPHRVVMMTP